jgi:ATP-dependent DNA ligase
MQIHLLLGTLSANNKNFSKLLQKHEWYYEPKIDGFRAIVFPDNNVYSRYGNKFNVNLNLKIPKDYCIDGELINTNYYDTFVIRRKYNIDVSKVKLCVFDIVPTNIILKGGDYNVSYLQRKEMLKEFYEKNKNNKYLIFLDYKPLKNKDVFQLLKTEFKHHEGLMLKQKDSPYITKRTKYWIKVKHQIDIDAKVIDIEIANNLMKALACSYENKTFKVGTGFTIEQRKLIAKLKSKLIGAYINLHAFELTENAVRHPAFNYFQPNSLSKDIIKELCEYKLMKPDVCN